MENVETIVGILNYILGTKQRRHVIGGALLSVSLLFGGLAITAMTLRTEEKDE